MRTASNVNANRYFVLRTRMLGPNVFVSRSGESKIDVPVEGAAIAWTAWFCEAMFRVMGTDERGV